MIKIYSAHALKMVWDLCIMLSILYGVAWAFFGPDISKIVNEIVMEVIKYN